MLVWQTIRFVLVDILWQIVFFPLWWYTAGTMKVIQHLLFQVRTLLHSLRFDVLLSFLFTPMYGQNDFFGRLISFFVRLVHFFVLFVWAILYSVILFFFLCVWLSIPFFVVYSMLYHFSLLPSTWNIL